MNTKQKARTRRARKARATIKRLGATRLTVYRTPRHFYAQIVSAEGNTILASASTLDAEVKKDVKNGGNIDAAKAVGMKIAERAKSNGVESVAFDRAGFKYHGRISAFADAAREGGLKF